ncbi:MAG: EF-hand domain-containing protein [Desulfobacterales bacterium]|nr:EF-hand domain-containing protein [Desulfobacterales bacterium]MDD4073739.1 EF-hand domain-containing protein [Desulfobacterales bacterium]MDD4394189.1 EF-hand domain-containing protein [Desulfobacterales bacterium]
MINGINSMSSSAMSMMSSSSTVRQQPPPGNDVFQMTDTDSDGLVSETELETLVAGLEEITGTSIDVEEALSSFDADEDGALSGEELRGLMDSNGFSPSDMASNESGETQSMQPPPPPPPAVTEQALSAYAQNTEDDQIEQLMQFLEEQNSAGSEFSSVNAIEFSSINVIG